MAGLFDDLIAQAQQGSQNGAAPPLTVQGPGNVQAAPAQTAGLFDDLIAQVQQPAAAGTFDPEGTGSANYDTPADPTATPMQRLRSLPGAAVAAADGFANSIPFTDRMAAAAAAATGLGGTFGDYSGNLAQLRGEEGSAMAAHPLAAIAGSFAGGAALPVGAIGTVAKGATLGGKITRGALAGGLIGGTEGASSSPDLSNGWQVAKDAGAGAGVGAAMGGALPAGAQAYGAAMRLLRGDPVAAIPGINSAARDVYLGAIAKDGPANVQRNAALYGDPAMLFDYGTGLRGVAEGLATKDGPAASTIGDALGYRQAATNARVRAGLTENFGPAVSPGDFGTGLQADRNVQNAQLPSILGSVPSVDISGPLAHIDARLPYAGEAEGNALQKARSLLTRPDPANPGQTVPITDPQQVHDARQDLDAYIKYEKSNPLQPSSSAVQNENGAFQTVRRGVSDALKQQVPGYGDAMAAYHNSYQRGEAFDLGRSSLAGGDNPVWPSDFAQQYGQQAAINGGQNSTRSGQRTILEEAVGTKPNDQNAIKGLMQTGNTPGYTAPGVTPGNPDLTGWNAQKLATTFGQQPMASMQELLNANDAFNATFNGVSQNSRTARREAMAKALEDADWKPKDLIEGRGSDATFMGLGLEAGRKVVNTIGRAFQNAPSTAARDADLARVGTMTGPERQAMVSQLMNQLPSYQGREAMDDTTRRRALTMAAALANQPVVSPQVLAAALRNQAAQR